jgi:DNA-binding MarR family transcriptional regulator
MEKSLFIEFMGDSPTIRVLDYLLTEKDIDFSISDMARNSGVGRTTLYRIWDKLIKNNIIVPTREIGQAKLFKLNTENQAIKKLLEIDNSLVLQDLKKRAGDKEIKVSA